RGQQARQVRDLNVPYSSGLNDTKDITPIPYRQPSREIMSFPNHGFQHDLSHPENPDLNEGDDGGWVSGHETMRLQEERNLRRGKQVHQGFHRSRTPPRWEDSLIEERHDAAPFRGVKEQSLHEAVEEDESSRHWVEPSRLSKGFSQAIENGAVNEKSENGHQEVK
ncbi:MAG: hypothetical protein TREMPRED_003405, partial [Tremellales sp. Tagirdzhanova-0007]